MAGRALAPLVLNNGAAGMPNFRGDGAGLFTRIALQPHAGPERRFGSTRAAPGGTVHLEAIALEADPERTRAEFLRQWPEGSDGHTSYWTRIAAGPDYAPEEALRESAD
jgi:hypothetical protein